MDKPIYSFALEDELLLEYLKLIKPEKFKTGDTFSASIIKDLLSYHIYPFIYGSNQIINLDINLDTTWKKQANLKNEPLQVLAEQTYYKCILSRTKDTFPYVKIGGADKICPSITGSFYYNQSRDKAIQHIKSLCKSAKSIMIWDPYLTSDPNAISALTSILPQNNQVKIILHDKKSSTGYDPTTAEKQLQNSYPWDIQLKRLSIYQHHDRYLVIDDEKQIILTSGFTNLTNDPTAKDFTYIIKPYEPHLF